MRKGLEEKCSQPTGRVECQCYQAHQWGDQYVDYLGNKIQQCYRQTSGGRLLRNQQVQVLEL